MRRKAGPLSDPRSSSKPLRVTKVVENAAFWAMICDPNPLNDICENTQFALDRREFAGRAQYGIAAGL